MKESLPNNRHKENIVTGKNITPEERRLAEAKLRHLSFEGILEPVSEQELEKTHEELELITIANKKILQKFKEFDIGMPQFLEPEAIHVLPEKYTELAMEYSVGRYESMSNSILIKRKEGSLDFFKSVIHELLHAYSCNKFIIEKDKEKLRLSEYRSGYAIPKKDASEEGYYVQFRGFTEALVEDLTLEIASNSADDLVKLSGQKINKDVLKIILRNSNSYKNERRFLHRIIDEYCFLKNSNNEDQVNSTNVLETLRKGLFTGEMMHLREFEKTFGPGTLRVLAKYYDEILDISDEAGLDGFEKEDTREERYQQFIYYFTANPDLRPAIAKGLLKDD